MDRPDRGPAQGPEAPRPARRDAGRLGRRVRPHADARGPRRRQRRSSAATTTRTASPIWLAGGGIKRRVSSHGETDELGYSPATEPVHVHDLQATILHLLGLDHKRLTYRFQGRDHRLTDVPAGEVVKEILA